MRRVPILIASLFLLVGHGWSEAEAQRIQSQEDPRIIALERRILERPDDPQARWALAQLLIEGERWREAVEALAPLAPDSLAVATIAKLRVNMALEAYRAGQIERARAVLEVAVRDDPTLAEAAVMLGQLHLEAEDYEAARRVAEGALEHTPGDGRLLAIRSATLEGREGLEAAVGAARALRRDRPDDEALALELARLLGRAGELPQMLALYDTLLARPEPGEEVFKVVSTLWLSAGQPDTAAAILIRGVDLHTRSGELWERLGEAEWERENWRDAARAYRMAAVRLERPERAEMAVADSYLMAGDTASALDALRSMRDRPAPRGALLEVARRAISIGCPPLADSIYELLLARSPHDIAALEGAARLAEDMGDKGRAIELYRRSTEAPRGGAEGPLGLLRLAEPANADSARALVRLALWRAVEAVGESELALADDSGEGESREGGLSRLEAEDPLERARGTLVALMDSVVFETGWGAEELAQLRRAYPSSLFLRRYEADLAARRGRLEEALRGYDRLLRARPTDVNLQIGRAETLEGLGREDEARATYIRLLELVPGDESVFRALVRLERTDEGLERLLVQIRRLQRLHPDLAELIDREVEVLHRLDRLDEARRAAAKKKERNP